MFYQNVQSDRDSNYITAESLLIELIAGGLSKDQQNFIMDRMLPNNFREISFLDYLAYIPLFLSMHDNMCDNPLDMGEKYKPNRSVSPQRDQNPLGHDLKKDSVFIKQNYKKNDKDDLRKKAEDIIIGRKTPDPKDNVDLYKKHNKLHQMIDGTESFQKNKGKWKWILKKKFNFSKNL